PAVPGASGNCDGLVVPGWTGGGSWPAVTVPAGAGDSGAGPESMREKRSLWQPAKASAISEVATTMPPVLKVIQVPPSGRGAHRPYRVPSSARIGRSFEESNARG